MFYIADTTSLFILQLACIVNRVTRWKKLSIRVFVAARDNNYGGSNDDDIGSNGTDLEGNAIHSTSNRWYMNNEYTKWFFF